MKIILTGGGTAGHVSPHLAILNELKNHYDQIIYIGSHNGIEKEMLKPYKEVVYYPITTTKLVRNKILKNVLIPFQLIKGIHESRKILKQEKPNIIFSKGGYVALPVVIASRRYKIPVVAHESDLKMGLANKLSKKNAKVICTTFKQTADGIKNKGVYTGSALKNSNNLSQNECKQKLGIITNKPVLLVTGGSLGAKFINNRIREEIKLITQKYYVVHLCGKNNLDSTLNNFKDYKQIDFTNDMMTYLKAADIVVSRAGSNTIFEIACLKKPMLLIPLPKGNSRGDQIDNAKYFNKNGYANFVSQEQLQYDGILKHIDRTYRDRHELESNLKNANIKPANEKIVEIIVKNSKI